MRAAAQLLCPTVYLHLAISFVVEAAQLYQASWINAIRSTTLGHLVLGSQFGWIDLVAYAVGACLGLGVELAFDWSRSAPRY